MLTNTELCTALVTQKYYVVAVNYRNSRFSAMLGSVDYLLFTDVSEQPIGPIFTGQAIQEDFLNCFYP